MGTSFLETIPATCVTLELESNPGIIWPGIWTTVEMLLDTNLPAALKVLARDNALFSTAADDTGVTDPAALDEEFADTSMFS